MRLLVVLCALTVTTAVSAAAPSPVRATMSTSATKPLAEAPWRYTVVVKDRTGKALAAKMRLQVLSGSTIVRCWKRTRLVVCSNAGAGTWIAFTGKRTGVIRWPAQSAGEKLTFQAIVVTGTRSLRLRAPVTVQLP
ncbi:MAG TPA: hypothetical protein VFU84_09095 [Gaiellaceae bacterium]|nr:hypothetical protein [Gaiellaceae bacterium]